MSCILHGSGTPVLPCSSEWGFTLTNLEVWCIFNPSLSVKADSLKAVFFFLYKNHILQILPFQNVSQVLFPWLILLQIPTDPPEREHCNSPVQGCLSDCSGVQRCLWWWWWWWRHQRRRREQGCCRGVPPSLLQSRLIHVPTTLPFKMTFLKNWQPLGAERQKQVRYLIFNGWGRGSIQWSNRLHKIL